MAKKLNEKFKEKVAEKSENAIKAEQTIDDFIDECAEMRGTSMGAGFRVWALHISKHPFKMTPEAWSEKFNEYKVREVK